MNLMINSNLIGRHNEILKSFILEVDQFFPMINYDSLTFYTNGSKPILALLVRISQQLCLQNSSCSLIL